VDEGKRKGSFRKIGVIVLLAAAIIIAIALWEWGGDWRHYATTMEGTHFYDVETMRTVTGQIRTVRTAFYSQKVGTSYAYYFDCENRRYSRRTVRDSTLMRLVKAVLELAGSGYDAPTRLISPGSPEEKLSRVVCEGAE
jgi:hypothetical protein